MSIIQVATWMVTDTCTKNDILQEKYPSKQTWKSKLQNSKHWKTNEKRLKKICTIKWRIHEEYINEYVWDNIIDFDFLWNMHSVWHCVKYIL